MHGQIGGLCEDPVAPPHREAALPFLEGGCCPWGREAPHGLHCAPQSTIPKWPVSQTFSLHVSLGS